MAHKAVNMKEFNLEIVNLDLVRWFFSLHGTHYYVCTGGTKFIGYYYNYSTKKKEKKTKEV